MKPVRWGIIGVGNVCEVKSGPGLQKAEGSSLVHVMRRSGQLAKDYAERHNVPRWTDNADTLIHDPEVDAIYIATPPGSHRAYVIKAAAAGKPLYVEKPMARTHAECQQMIGACESAGVPLFVAYYRRALPRFERARKLIQSGELGSIRVVQLTLYQPATIDPTDRDNLPWRLRAAHAGGGIFFDLASHGLDWLDHALGPITSVYGTAANQAGLYDVEDIVAGQWQHASGVMGSGVWCFSTAERHDEIRIVGSKGTLTFSCFGTEALMVTTAEGTRTIEAPTPPHVQQPLIQTMVDELHGKGTCASTGESAARTSWVMDEMVHTYRLSKGIRIV